MLIPQELQLSRIGQVLIAYTTTPRKQKKDGSSPTRMSGDGHEDTPHNEQ